MVRYFPSNVFFKHIAFDCESVRASSSGNSDALLSFNGQCYIFFRKRLDWLHARDTCKQLNGSFDLLSVLSEDEMSFTIDYMKLIKAKRAWIGLNDIDKENEFKWADGSVFNYGSQLRQYPWRDIQPDNVSCSLVTLLGFPRFI